MCEVASLDENSLNKRLLIITIITMIFAGAAGTYLVWRYGDIKSESIRKELKAMRQADEGIIGGTDETYFMIVSGWAYPGIVVDPEGRIKYANMKAQEEFPIGDGDGETRCMFDLMRPANRERHERILQHFEFDGRVAQKMKAQRGEALSRNGWKNYIVDGWTTPTHRFLQLYIPTENGK